MGNSPFGLTVPFSGRTDNESAYSGSPTMDYFSNQNVIGTSSKFFNLTTSLFFPPINKGPKLTFPTLKKVLASITVPTIKKYYVILCSGISKIQ